jgi:hypothetical protein
MVHGPTLRIRQDRPVESAPSKQAAGHQAESAEPPPWLPRTAVATLPLTLLAAAAGGTFHVGAAIAALLLGLFGFVFLVGWWIAPASSRGFVVVTAAAAVCAVFIVGSVVVLSIVADDHLTEPKPAKRQPSLSSTTSTTSTTVATTSTTL